MWGLEGGNEMKTPCGRLTVFILRTAMALVVMVLILQCPIVFADTWDIQTVDFEEDVGQFTSLALDTLGFPHISYHDVTNENLKYAFLDEDGWHLQIVDFIGDVQIPGGPVSAVTSIALNAMGFPRIAYCCESSDLRYAYQDSNGWHVQAVADVNGLGASMVLDPSDFAHISHGPWEGGGIYSYQDESGWTHEALPCLCIGFLTTSLALDALRNPHITYVSYAPNDYCMRHAYKTAGSWESEVVEHDHTAGAGSSLLLDESGVLHATHVLVGGSWSLKYTWKDVSGWNSQTIEQIDFSMMQWITSLKLDSQGNPHVCYMGDGYDLVIQHGNGSEWVLEAVDREGQVGMHPSMVLDPSDRPHISYYDITNGDLKYARFLPSQFKLAANLQDNQLLLTWEPVFGISSYWVFGTSHEPWFEPDLSAPTYVNRLAVIPVGVTAWSSANGVGNQSDNWTYLLSAIDDSNLEIVRSNRVGEHDFDVETP